MTYVIINKTVKNGKIVKPKWCSVAAERIWTY